MFSGHGFERFGGCVEPGEQLVDRAIEMSIDDLRQHIGEVGVGFTPLSLQFSISVAMTAQLSPPPSEPREERILTIESHRIGQMAITGNPMIA